MAARVCGCMTMADGSGGDVMIYTSTTHTYQPGDFGHWLSHILIGSASHEEELWV